jgi:hypothetical protein
MKDAGPFEWIERAGEYAREMPARTLGMVLIAVLFTAWIFSEPVFRLHDRLKRGGKKLNR